MTDSDHLYDHVVKANNLSTNEAVDKVMHYFNCLIVDPLKYHSKWEHYTTKNHHLFCLRQYTVDQRGSRSIRTTHKCTGCPMHDEQNNRTCNNTRSASFNSMTVLKHKLELTYSAAKYSRDDLPNKLDELALAARVRRDEVIHRLKETNSYHIE